MPDEKDVKLESLAKNPCALLCLNEIQYQQYYNSGVLFFKMDFWVGFNSDLAII